MAESVNRSYYSHCIIGRVSIPERIANRLIETQIDATRFLQIQILYAKHQQHTGHHEAGDHGFQCNVTPNVSHFVPETHFLPKLIGFHSIVTAIGLHFCGSATVFDHFNYVTRVAFSGWAEQFVCESEIEMKKNVWLIIIVRGVDRCECFFFLAPSVNFMTFDNEFMESIVFVLLPKSAELWLQLFRVTHQIRLEGFFRDLRIFRIKKRIARLYSVHVRIVMCDVWPTFTIVRTLLHWIDFLLRSHSHTIHTKLNSQLQ